MILKTWIAEAMLYVCCLMFHENKDYITVNEILTAFCGRSLVVTCALLWYGNVHSDKTLELSTCSGKRFQGLSLWGGLDLGPLEREGASEGTTSPVPPLKNPTKLASNKMLNVSPLQPTHKKRCDPKYYIAVSTVEDETNVPTSLAIYLTFFSLDHIYFSFLP